MRILLFLFIGFSLSADVAEVIPKLQTFIEKGLAESHVPGAAVAIVEDGQVVLVKGFGFRDLENKKPVTADTLFQLASVSKPLTTSILAAQEKISFKDKIADLDPAFQLSSPYVTANLMLKDLLSHRSGLPDHAGDLLEDLGYPLDQILFRLRFITPLGAFREDYAYTNFGFSEAAYAAAKKLNTGWEQLAKKTLNSFGMKATTPSYRDYSRHPERALTYLIEDNEPKLLDPPRQPDAQSPAGGFSSTARDMAVWLIRQLDPDPKLLETHTPAITTGVNEKTGLPSLYALGWDVGIDPDGHYFLRHSGAFRLGVRTQVALLPEKKIGIAILTNAQPSGLPEAISKAFFDFLFTGETEPDLVQKYNALWMEHEVDPVHRYTPAGDPSLSLTTYTGDYENNYFGPVTITSDKDQLQLTIGPAKKIFPLKHLTRDVFSFETIGENATGEAQVIFSVDESGKAESFTIDAFNKFGMGQFTVKAR